MGFISTNIHITFGGTILYPSCTGNEATVGSPTNEFSPIPSIEARDVAPRRGAQTESVGTPLCKDGHVCGNCHVWLSDVGTKDALKNNGVPFMVFLPYVGI